MESDSDITDAGDEDAEGASDAELDGVRGATAAWVTDGNKLGDTVDVGDGVDPPAGIPCGPMLNVERCVPAMDASGESDTRGDKDPVTDCRAVSSVSDADTVRVTEAH